MRIVQLITHMNEIGGAQVHVRDISKQLVHDGHSVFIISGGKNQIASDLKVEEINYIYSKYLIRRINIMKDLLAFIELRKRIKQLKPDIVAIHSSKAGIIGRLASWSVRTPCVFTVHGWAFTEGVKKNKQRVYRPIEKWIGKLTQKVITVCDYDCNLAIKQEVLPAKKIVTIHNGIIDSRKNAGGEVSRDVVKILMVARFDKQKRQIELLQGLLNLKDLNWHMVFVGDGQLKERSVQYVKDNLMEHKVTFLGSHANVKELLNDADLFALTSGWEGLPLSILEAMAYELPIIASDVGGVKEAVRDTENGFLIHNNLTEVLRLLIEDKLLRNKMGARSREIYEANFTFEKMYAKTISTYQHLIE